MSDFCACLVQDVMHPVAPVEIVLRRTQQNRQILPWKSCNNRQYNIDIFQFMETLLPYQDHYNLHHEQNQYKELTEYIYRNLDNLAKDNNVLNIR